MLKDRLFALPSAPHKYVAAFQRELLLSVCPGGTTVLEVRFAPQYTVKGPALVRVAHPDGSERTLVLKMSGSPHGIVTEAQLLPVLERLGLPVPRVLAGPAFNRDDPQTGPSMVMSYLPGTDLQRLSMASPAELDSAGKLVMDGIARLHSLTAAIRQEAIGRQLPQVTLLTELRHVIERGGPWLQAPLFRRAAQQLVPILAEIQTPLIFSNGDYQPANFLTDGQRVVGFLDFDLACFEDPHYGVAKYRVYDMAPLHKAGFVERYLNAHGLSEVDLAPRMAVRCLWTLQREIPIADRDGEYGSHVIQLLREALQRLAEFRPART
jgi:aminoglycoside phosphotransferase (APT) family kinase protein